MAEMSGDVLFSAILPTLNEAHNIERALTSVSGFHERIVVDGGSNDQTIAIATSMGAKAIAATPGRGSQLSEGARHSTADILLFLHADSWLAESAIEQLRGLVEQRAGQPVFGCFRQQIDAAGWLYRWLERGNAFRAGRLGLPYGDQAMFVDRQLYQKVGGFSSVPLMEDVILSKRLRRVCRPIVLDGPVHVSARRWQAKGVLHQTIRNWTILAAFSFGVSPQRLTKWYH